MSETGIETIGGPVNHLGMTRENWDAINAEPTDGGEKKAWGAPWFDYKPEVAVKETSESKKQGWGGALLALLLVKLMNGNRSKKPTKH